MLKSEIELFQTSLHDLMKTSEEIYKILNNNEEFSSSIFENLEDLFNKRQKLLDYLDSFRNSVEGKEIILKNSEKWNKVIKKVADIDNKNLEIIKNGVNFLANKLQEFNKKKNLLLYNKESVKWI